MKNCTNCSDGTMQDAKYICHTNDYRVVDLSDNLLLKVEDHGIPSGNSEIGDGYTAVNFCSCGKFWS